jgi:hypothetical protein
MKLKIAGKLNQEFLTAWKAVMNGPFTFSICITSVGGQEDFGIGLPDDCDDECYKSMFNTGLTAGNEILKKHYENPAGWTLNKTEGWTQNCFNVTIEGGGSCYGGYGCHGFQWDYCGGVEFTINMPEGMSEMKKKPKGVKFSYNRNCDNQKLG